MSRKQEQNRNLVYSNQLMTMLLDALGQEVVVETRDGSKFEGIFAGTSELDIGLAQVHRVEPDKLLPHKDDVVEKMIFAYDDYVCISVTVQDEKPKIKGFATDREYQARNGPVTDGLAGAFEPWDGDESVEIEETTKDLNDLNDGGWSADDMFHVNKALGVESTYVDNLSQYTNAPVIEKDNESRSRAEKIAREIEQDRTSKANALLENDDEERDLDKPTVEYQVQNHRRNLPANRPSYGNNPKGNLSSGPNSGRGAPQGGRRGESAMNPGRGGRGGSYSSSGNTSRTFSNSALTHGGKGSGGSLSGSSYGRFQPGVERPNAQAVHSEFNQFEMRQTGGDGSATSVGNASKSFSERRTDQSESGSSNKKAYETNIRNVRHSANSPHNRSGGDDSRVTHRGGSPHTGGRSQGSNLMRASSSSSSSGAGNPKGKHSERVNSLISFQKSFDNAYQPSQAAQGHSSVEDSQGSGSSASSSTIVSNTVLPPTNAWTRGPPPSIRSPPTQSSQPSGVAKEPTPAESVTQSAVPENIQSLQKPREVTPSAQPTPASSVTVTQVLPTVSTASTGVAAENPLRLSTSDSSSPPSSQSTSATIVSSMQQMTIANSATGTPVHSANGSSSSIAPVDPQPSVNTSIGSSTGPSTTPAQSSKKFEFNPDAAPFTPRSVIAHTPTPRSTPAPASTGTVHGTHPMHQMSINPSSTMSAVAQGIPSGMLTHSAASAFSFNPNAGVYSPVSLYYQTQSVLPMGTQLAPVSASPSAAGVTGGPIVTGSTNMPTGRAGQVGGNTPGTRRAVLSGAAPVYISNAVPYGPQMIPQYPINVFAASPFQQIPMASASVPPPSVPPPVSSGVAVGAAAQPLQILQTQQQHPQAAYARQYYQPGQGYLVATAAPRGYAPQHQNMDYNGSGQQPSSTASSNGNGSNGHNSQPATPGPQPIASPAQVAYPSATNTPQPAHPVLMPIQSGPPHHPQHMYVQPPSAQFPFMPNAGYMVYNPQQMMQLSAVPSAAPMGLSQASQPVPMDHYQSVNETHGTNQHSANNQTHGSIPSQQYTSADQPYGQYVHGGN